MQLNPIRTNMTEITLPSGRMVLFSYKTPVACFIPGKGFYETAQHYSATTSRHLSDWLHYHKAQAYKGKVTQAYLDESI